MALCPCFPEIQEILNDPSAHNWLKETLAAAIRLDPIDVTNDAIYLATVLDRWSDHMIAAHSPSA